MKRIGGTGSDEGQALTTDQDNNIYLTGYINGTADLNSDNDTTGPGETTTSPYGNDDIFLSKWSATGTHLWSERIGGTSDDYGYALTTDQDNNLYLTGRVYDTADLNSDGDTTDPGETTASPYGSNDIFLSKWSATGTHLWSERIGGTSDDYGQALTTDQDNNIYLTGYINGTADLNSDNDTTDPGETTASPYGNNDIFLSKWSATGTHLWSERIGGASTDYGQALTTDQNNNIYLTGVANGAADLNGNGDLVDGEENVAYPYASDDIILLRFSNDHQIATGSLEITDDTGTITFATSTSYHVFNTGSSTGFLVELTASNLGDCDNLVISWGGASTTGAITGYSLLPYGQPSPAHHNAGSIITVSDHPLGQVANGWQNQTRVSDLIHYRFRLTPASGQSFALGTTTLALSGISGLRSADIISAKLQLDSNSDGRPDPIWPQSAGQASISGANGTLVFPPITGYSLDKATDFLVSFSLSELRTQNEGLVGLDGNISVQGNVSIQVGQGTPLIPAAMSIDLDTLENQTCSLNTSGTSSPALHQR
jgi:hypothetical protein